MTDFAEQYRQLLTTDESIATLDSALSLARRIATEPAGKKAIRLLDQSAADAPALSGGKSANSRRVESVEWALTVLAGEIETRSRDLPPVQYSLLRDVLLLVFHQAYFALLPSVARDRARLLAAFAAFADTVPHPSDQCQVRGLVELAHERFATAVECFRSALAATHADEHDFLTRVQMLWTVLVEQHRWNDAFRCLVDIYPRVTRNDLEEVSALLDRTFMEAQQYKPHLRGKAMVASR